MSAIPSTEQKLAASIAAHQSWANTENRSARTAPARAALDARFLAEAGGDPQRASHLRKAYFARLALKSAQSRRKSREATSVAEQAEAELAALGGGDGEPPPGGPGRAAPGTQQHPAERRHRQRDGRTQGIRREHESRGSGSAAPEAELSALGGATA